MTHITIHGRRWFQRSYGNTYHTVSVEIDGQHVFTAPKQYGYGDQYIQTAMEWLNSEDARSCDIPPARQMYDNGSGEGLWEWAKRTGFTYSAMASDVAREKDL